MKDNRYSVSQVRSLVVGDQKLPFIISVFVMVPGNFWNTTTAVNPADNVFGVF